MFADVAQAIDWARRAMAPVAAAGVFATEADVSEWPWKREDAGHTHSPTHPHRTSATLYT